MILNINKTKTTISFDHNWPLIDIKVTKVIIPTPEDGPLSSDMFTFLLTDWSILREKTGNSTLIT